MYEFMLARLSQFRAAFPGIELSLEASPQMVDFATCDIDAAFRVAAGSWPSLMSHVIGDAQVAPVCAPELAQRVRRVGHFQVHTLIDLRSQAQRGWRAFMKKQGLPEPERVLYFDGYLEVLRAAEQGLGIAFGIFPMATEWVTSGRLAVPLSLRSPFAGKVSFVYRKAEARDPLYAQLAAWLRQQYAKLPALPAGRLLRRTRRSGTRPKTRF